MSLQWIRHQRHRRGCTVVRYERPQDLISRVIDDACSGRRVCVACTSKQDVLNLERWLRDEGIESILAYHGDSPSDQRKTLSDVNQTWSQVQVVLYSPAIDCGVSYDPPDPTDRFDAVFLLARPIGGRGTTWTSLLQMISRCRNMTRLHAYVAGGHNRRCTEKAVETEAGFRVGAAIREVSRAGITVPDTVEFPDYRHWQLFLAEELDHRVLSRRTAECFFAWWSERGADVLEGTSLDQSDFKDVVDRLRAIREELEKERAHQVLEAPLMDEREFCGFREPTTQAEIDSHEHSRLVSVFGSGLVDEQVATEDRYRRLTRTIHRRVIAEAILAGDLDIAIEDEMDRLRTGYAAHASGEVGAVRAAISVVQAALKVGDIYHLFSPPMDVTHLCIGRDIDGVCDTASWSELEPLWFEVDRRMKSQCLGEADLERVGIRRFAGWAKAVGTALAFFGIATQSKQRRVVLRDENGKEVVGRDGKIIKTRVRSYSIDPSSALRMRRLSAVSHAKKRGVDVSPLSSDCRGDEWKLAVRSGKWATFRITLMSLSPPSPPSPSNEAIDRRPHMGQPPRYGVVEVGGAR